MGLRDTMRRIAGRRAEEEDEEARGAALEEKDEDEAAEEEDRESERDEDEAADEEDDDEARAEEEDETDGKSARGGRSRASAAIAVMKSPEARGREKLAGELADDVVAGRLSSKRAVTLLKAAPKASRLSDAMAGRDIDPGADGGNRSANHQAGWEKAFGKLPGKRPAR